MIVLTTGVRMNNKSQETLKKSHIYQFWRVQISVDLALWV